MKVERALTILNPWAWLISAGHKPVENRTWASTFRGPVAIHAGSNMRELYDDELEKWLCSLHPNLEAQLSLPLIPGDDPKRPKISSIFHPGAILGVAEMIDCISFNPETDDFEQLCRDRGHGKWYDSFEIPPAEFASGPECFLLAKGVKEFTVPIPCKGALNFWYLKASELAAVAAALKRPLGSPYHYRAKLAATRKPQPAGAN